MFRKKNAYRRLSSVSDADLAVSIREGSAEAYRELFMRYYSVVYRFLERMFYKAGIWESAEDVAQNVFMKVWIGRACLDEHRSIKSFIYTIARNEALNILNSRARTTEELVESIQDRRPDAQAEMELKQLEESIAGRIAELPEQRQRVFRLSRIYQMENDEIATMLGIAKRTVDKHIELALKDIRHDDIS